MTIGFEPVSHTYRLADGRQVPHVTGILVALEQFYGVPPSALEYAAERGRDVHAACQYLDEGDLDEGSLDAEIAPYVAAYRRFLADVRPEWIAIEERVYSERWGYAGTLDRAGLLSPHGVRGERRVVLDIKTVSSLSPVTGLQLAAYDEAYRGGDRRSRALLRYGLQLRPSGDYRLQRYDEPTDLSVFLAQLTVAGWCRRHGKTQEIAA